MASSDYYTTGGGKLKFSKLVNGVYQAEEDFGQTENIGFSTTIETITHDNTEGATAFEDLNILKKVTGKLNIETLEISPKMINRAFLGADNTVVIANNAISSNVSLGYLTATQLNTPYDIGIKYLTTSTILVKDDTDTDTYVLDTDYTLSTDAKTGITTITALSSGSILALDILHITAENISYNDISIEGFIDTKLEGRLVFISDAANGISYKYTFHRVSLSASGDFALKSSGEFVKLTFEGAMLASETITDVGTSKLFKIEGTSLN